MKEISYSAIDKSQWGPGPWQEEPDKLQFMTAAGLPGLIVRGPIGALCGYVGVSAGHPYHGVGYGSCPVHCGLDRYADEGQPRCEHDSPDMRLDVHGGLTFSSFCYEPTPEAWERWRTNLRGRMQEAEAFPRGDSAAELRTKGQFLDDYDGWADYVRRTAICHLTEAGDADHVWWLGFDCAHAGDFCPKYREYGLDLPSLHRDGDVYANLTYVREQVESLAAQLVKVAA